MELPEPLQRFNPTPEQSRKLAEFDALVTRFRALKSAGQIPENTLQALRIELTYHSNAIEGNTLTLRETQLVIEGKSPPGQKDLREIYEARNHDRALRLIEQSATARGEAALTENDLLSIHAQVLADIAPADAGCYRSGRVLIAGTGYVPPGSAKFGVLMPKLFELSELRGSHPLIIASELHYNLVAVHPFNDGNGRTARLMMNAFHLRHNFPYVVIEVTKRSEYLAGLDEANHGRTGGFIDLMIEAALSSVHRTVG